MAKKTIVHVNQFIIKKNAKHGTRDPVLTVKNGRTNRYAHEVIFHGPSKVVYHPDKPLSCGAKCWIETESTVTLIKDIVTDGIVDHGGELTLVACLT
jgi:hypothetical protein